MRLHLSARGSEWVRQTKRWLTHSLPLPGTALTGTVLTGNSTDLSDTQDHLCFFRVIRAIRVVFWLAAQYGSVPEMFHDGVFQVGEVGFAEQAEPRSNLVVKIGDVPPGGNLAIDEIADPDRKQAAQEGDT